MKNRILAVLLSLLPAGTLAAEYGEGDIALETTPTAITATVEGVDEPVTAELGAWVCDKEVDMGKYADLDAGA